MSNYIRSKSFSNNKLNITVNFFLPQRSPHFHFKIRNSRQSREAQTRSRTKLTTDHSQALNTRLKQFKSRLIKGLDRSRDKSNSNSFEDMSIFRNIKLNQLFAEDEKRQHVSTEFAQGTVFVRQKQSKLVQAENPYLSMYSRKKKSNKTDMSSGEMSWKESEEPPKHSKSIMIIRKMNQMKEKIVLDKKEKYQEQFHKVKQTPIHHSQLFKVKKTNKKLKQQKNNSFGNKSSIKEILKLREAMSKNSYDQFKKTTQNLSFQVIVKGKSKFNQQLVFQRNNQGLQIQVEEYKKQKKKISLRKNIGEKQIFAKKDQQIGPWLRRKNQDLQIEF